jgi:hypothetical protein
LQTQNPKTPTNAWAWSQREREACFGVGKWTTWFETENVVYTAVGALLAIHAEIRDEKR